MNGDNDMAGAWHIAFGKDGVWAVSDYNHNFLYVFDSQDKLIRKFGQTGDAQFTKPWGLSFDANNH